MHTFQVSQIQLCAPQEKHEDRHPGNLRQLMGLGYEVADPGKDRAVS